MDVGWWLSVDNCDLHHPLHCAWPCEVLICGQWSADILVRKAPQAFKAFRASRSCGQGCPRSLESLFFSCFIAKNLPLSRGFRVRLRRKA